METKDIAAVRGFLKILVGILMAMGGQPMVTALMAKEPQNFFPALVVCLMGTVILLAGFFWHPKLDSEGRFFRTLAAIASDARTHDFPDRTQRTQGRERRDRTQRTQGQTERFRVSLRFRNQASPPA